MKKINYLHLIQYLHVASTGILDRRIYTACTVHSVARYAVTSILVQILRDFVPREHVFLRLTNERTRLNRCDLYKYTKN